MDFRALPPRKRPNQWLICPPGFASRAPDEEAPLFDAPVEALQSAWKDVVANQPRIAVVRDEAGGMELTQRTRVLGFTDDVAVSYVDLKRGRSSIALLSRSRVGYSDLGTNRRRLRGWLAALEERLPVVRSPDGAKV